MTFPFKFPFQEIFKKAKCIGNIKSGTVFFLCSLLALAFYQYVKDRAYLI